MTITTNATAKVASVATGFAMAFSMLAAAPLAHADQASDLQAQINSLMATIAALQSQLNATNGGSSNGSSYSFTRDLTIGSKGADVTALQNWLISKGQSIPAGATGFFGAQTQAAVASWQRSAGISPAAGYFGPKSRAAAGMSGGVTNPGVPGVPITGNGLKVMLSTDSPNNIALVQSQATGDLAHFTFQNPTGSDIKVTSVTFKRIGVSLDSALSNVYLFAGASRITDPAGISSGTFSFNDTNGVFTVPAGGSKTISVRADIAASTNGQQIGVQLTAVSSSGTLDSSVSLPISGYTQTVSGATLASVSFGTVSIPNSLTVAPGNDITLFQSTVTVNTRAALLRSITFENRGSSVDGDFQNLKLLVRGVQVGSTVSGTTNKKVTFDLSASPLRMETGNAEVRLVGDIVGGSGETSDFQIRRAIDAQFIDSDLMQAETPTGDFSGTADTIQGVDLSVTKASNSPSSNIAKDASSVKLASFEFRAIGDDLKVEQITVAATISGSNVDLANGKVFLNGVQIGSTHDIAEAAGYTFAFGSQMVLKRGTTAIVDIYSDAKQADDTSFSGSPTVAVSVAVATADTEGVQSGDRLTTAISAVSGNTLTVSASSLSASKVGSYSNQSVVAGTNNFKLGSFTLLAGSNEGLTLNTIAIAFAAAESSTLTNLRIVNHDTGAQIGATRTSIAGAAADNSFSGSIVLPASGSVNLDVYADVKSSANVGAISATTVTTSTGGPGTATGNSITVTTAATLQTMTVVSGGTLTTAVNTGGTPADAIVVGGTSMVKVGSFNFLATNAAETVNKVLVKVPNNSASAVAMLYLKDGSTGTLLKAQGFDLGSPGTAPYATSTFTGLGFAVPSGGVRALDVYADFAPIDLNNPALSGQSIHVLLDGNEGFEATDGAGNLTTTLTSSNDLDSDGTNVGVEYIFKSAPALAAVPVGNSPYYINTLSGGANQVIGKFTIAASATGGDNGIDWGKLAFTVTKSASVQVGATTTILLYDVTGGAHTNVGGTFATTTAGASTGLGTMEMFSTVTANPGGTSGIIDFRPTNAQNIPKGTAKTYQLETTIGGTLVSGNSLSLSLSNPSTATVANNQLSTIAGAIGTALSSSVPSFAWSDWSDVDHFTNATNSSATDWTSDYLVKSLPITAGTISMP